MKYPKMPSEIKAKLRDLRLKGKLGTLSPEENLDCAEAYAKYGDEQYDAGILKDGSEQGEKE
jgi:hypothetical protein